MPFDVERYRMFIFRIARNYTNSYEDAEDITQEVLLKISQSQKQFSNRYIALMTRSVCVDSYRKQKHWNFIEIDTHMEDNTNCNPYDLTCTNQLQERIDYLIKSILTDKQRQAITMILDGCKYSESSKTLNMTLGTFKSHYHRAIVKLRAHLSEFRSF